MNNSEILGTRYMIIEVGAPGRFEIQLLLPKPFQDPSTDRSVSPIQYEA